jgi:hypothetical protein
MRRVLDVAAEDEKNVNARRGAFGNARDANVAPLDSWYTLLDTQYRMHPAISSFPSRRFYASRVRDAGSTQTVPFFLRAPTCEGFFTNGAEERKKNAALRKWLKAPFAFVDVPFQAGSRSETRGSSGFLSQVSRTKGDKNETPSGSVRVAGERRGGGAGGGAGEGSAARDGTRAGLGGFVGDADAETEIV